MKTAGVFSPVRRALLRSLGLGAVAGPLAAAPEKKELAREDWLRLGREVLDLPLSAAQLDSLLPFLNMARADSMRFDETEPPETPPAVSFRR